MHTKHRSRYFTGSFTTADLFYGPPRLTAFTPDHAAAGDVVTLSGTNLTGATSLNVGGIDWTFSVVNNSTLQGTVPTHGLAGAITVATATAGSATATACPRRSSRLWPGRRANPISCD